MNGQMCGLFIEDIQHVLCRCPVSFQCIFSNVSFLFCGLNWDFAGLCVGLHWSGSLLRRRMPAILFVLYLLCSVDQR